MTEDPDEERLSAALESYVPDDEPPMGLHLDVIKQRGRRRRNLRRAGATAAAAVVVAGVLVGVPWILQSGEPGPNVADDLERTVVPPVPPSQAGDLTTAPSASASGTAAGTVGPTAAPSGAPDPGSGQNPGPDPDPGGPGSDPGPQPEFRMPAGHHTDADHTKLARGYRDRFPRAQFATIAGTNSDESRAGRHAFAFHGLWDENGRYGYILWLVRGTGSFPATSYGLPSEPCTSGKDLVVASGCKRISTPEHHEAVSFDVSRDGYRMRGVHWDAFYSQSDERYKDDVDTRQTIIIYIPEQGAVTPFPPLDDGPRLTSHPFTVGELADTMNVRRE